MHLIPALHSELPDEPAWPDAGGRRLVFLLDASSGLERRLLEGWLRRKRPETTAPGDYEVIQLPPSRRSSRRSRVDPRLQPALAAGDDPLLVPLRVAWLPALRDGTRAVRLSDLLTFGDPRDPGAARQAWVLRLHPDRCRILGAEPAPVSELRRRWRDAGATDAHLIAGLPEFVCRQATLALERAERRLRGARYKVPRFVREEILARPDFRGDLAALAHELGRPEAAVVAQASRYLREIAATHSTYMIDLVAQLNRRFYTRGYGEALHYDRDDLARIYALAQAHPVVFLPTHKSHLDHVVLQHALHENGLPPNHAAGGANLNIPPVASIFRRSGVFFIRRSFRDNPVYKHVLKSYIGYLVEKRFPLEWYIEGTRSRSGKLLPPRLGLLTYVVDAYERGRSEDVFLIPVSIAYDQIQGIHAYVAEQKGAAKPKERLGLFFRLLRGRGLHQQFGNVHLRFGEPLSLRDRLGPPRALEQCAPDARTRAVEALALEVAVRINRITPITPTSLVTLALLGEERRPPTLDELRAATGELLYYAKQHKLPTTLACESLHGEEGVAKTLEALAENRVVSRRDEARGAVYVVAPEHDLTAAYYRNTIVHFFVHAAIAELALVRAGEAHGGPAIAALWDEALRLRDLLKFEFFFAEPDAFRDQVRFELAFHEPAWEKQLAEGGEPAEALLRRLPLHLSPRVLRPFLDGYLVVGEALARLEPGTPFDERRFLDGCLRLGGEYLAERRIRSGASVSTALFQTALLLAEERGLLETTGPDVVARRAAFVDEVARTIRRLDAVEGLDAIRRAARDASGERS
ncbi:MAG TPA: glycerol-3-phosphate 1-O-acyltransferase [Myxococcota bacterium]|jgi:glycerol-3-phosphate O-acyltransferase|nr:glycerol-3-phosphate 1-O-acyltransferase [Myxococcota bacterium]